MVQVASGELKKKGISILENIIKDEGEAIITVRGKSKYVVLDMDSYNRFREYELEAALTETKRDLAEGNFVQESVDDHMTRIRHEV
jgi:PHD/YefM family antitoxin component YafN of YafNO toxin-antitoxin module